MGKSNQIIQMIFLHLLLFHLFLEEKMLLCFGFLEGIRDYMLLFRGEINSRTPEKLKFTRIHTQHVLNMLL